jgi:hypothetical protein
MRTLIRNGLVAAGLLATAGVAPAGAQVYDTIKFTTSFPFMVGTKMLPAGSYTVSPVAGIGASVLEVRGRKEGALFATENASLPRTDPKQTEVIFDKSGDHYVLTEVWDEASQQGAERVPSRTERVQQAEQVHDRQ